MNINVYMILNLHILIMKVNLTIADKSMNLYELNEKFENARQNGFIFIQINNIKIEIYSSPSNLNIC